MGRLGTLQPTEGILDALAAELVRAPGEAEPFVSLAHVAKFSRTKLAELNRVLSAAHLPAGVVIYDGSDYPRGRPPARLARGAVVVRVQATGDPEVTAVAARAQMDACRDRIDELRVGNAVVYVEADGVVEAKDGSINYYVRFVVWDH